MERTYIKDVKPCEKVQICGWIEKIREQKTMQFVVIKDRTGAIQMTIEKEALPKLAEIISGLTKYSVVTVEGKVVKAECVKLGGQELIPTEIKVQSIAQDSPISAESAQDLRLDYRWIDLREDKKRLIFEIRTFVEHAMREFFIKENFIEIHTPKITSQCSEGGAEVFPIEYYGQKAYLTQSPQFYKQMAIASGFEKVFEFGPYYRAEKSFTARHTAESFCVDLEVANVSSHHDVMDIEEKWILYVMNRIKEVYGDIIEREFGVEVKLPAGKIPRIKLADVFKIFKEKYGIVVPEEKQLDLDPEGEKLICEYAKEYLGSELVFIIDYPAEARAFYSRRENPEAIESFTFDMLYRGWEMNSGAMREHRYDRLRAQIAEKGINPDKMSGYLEFFKYGCPEHGGLGFGIDRFIAKLLNQPSLKETIFIFRGPNRLIP